MATPVVNVRRFRPFGDFPPFVYVGRACAGLRGHPLANPFKVGKDATDGERRACLTKYTAWLHTLPDLESRLRMLLGRTGGTLPLGCWCASWDGVSEPAPLCHAVVLSRLIETVR